MDSITHVVVGACLGEAFMGEKVGKRAMLYGAVLNSLPDIDAVAAIWLAPTEYLLAHRGITHSFLFAALASLFLAWWVNRWYRSREIPFTKWLLFISTAVFLHLFMDAANAYGTGWLEPFSHERFAFHILFVADPFFTIAPLIGSLVLWIMKPASRLRGIFALVALCVCVGYVLLSFGMKEIVSSRVDKQIALQKIIPQRHFTTPTPLNVLLWYTVAEVDSGFYVGYNSVFDHTSEPLTFLPARRSLLNGIDDSPTLKILKTFSQGFYVVEREDSTLVFNDLRFGQIGGWENVHKPYAFRFYLQRPEQNRLVIQRGRFSGWNDETIEAFFDRIKGN